jgi:ketosteroid isomerase-like protein
MLSSKLTDELSARVKEFWVGFQKGDKQACLGVYAESSTFFRSDQGFDHHFSEELAKNFEAWTHDHKVHGFQIDDPRAALVADDVAVLTYKQHFDSEVALKPQTTRGAITSVFVRQNGQWRIVHTHESCE